MCGGRGEVRVTIVVVEEEKKERLLGPCRSGRPRHLIASPHRVVSAFVYLSSSSLASALVPQINEHDHQARQKK